MLAIGVGIFFRMPKSPLSASLPYPAASVGLRPTVLLIHGYGFFNTCPSDDGAQKWGAVSPFLQAHGWQDIKRVGYYVMYALENPLTVGQGLFPPHVLIPQIVTLSAPNAGINFVGEVLTTYQAAEMNPNSPFMQELDTNALDPQWTGGTDWTTIGNYPLDRDLVVTAASATAMDPVHRVLYFDTSIYSHNGILDDTSTVRDAHVYRCDNCLHTARIINGDFKRYDDMPHSLDYINAALLSNAW